MGNARGKVISHCTKQRVKKAPFVIGKRNAVVDKEDELVCKLVNDSLFLLSIEQRDTCKVQRVVKRKRKIKHLSFERHSTLS